MKWHILILFFFCSLGRVHAKNLRVVICSDELGIEKVMAHDIWKQSAIFPNADYGVGGDSWEDKVKYVIEKVSSFEPLFAKGLAQNFKKLLSELDESFVDRVISPAGGEREIYEFGGETCEVKDSSMSFESPLYKQKSLYISRKIWEKLDHPSRAALILHELFYRSILDFDDSSLEEYLSYITFFFLSDLSENIEASEYFKFRFSRQYRTFNNVEAGLEKIKSVATLELLKNSGLNVNQYIAFRFLRYALYIITTDPKRFNDDLLTMGEGISEEDFVKYLIDESTKKKSLNSILYIYTIPQLVKTIKGFPETEQFLKDPSVLSLDAFTRKLNEFLDNSWKKIINRNNL